MVESAWVHGLVITEIVSSGGRVFQVKKAECARAPGQEQAWGVLGSGKQLEPGDMENESHESELQRQAGASHSGRCRLWGSRQIYSECCRKLLPLELNEEVVLLSD